MARLPQPGGDTGHWGSILNDYLSQAHKPDGTLKDNAVSSSNVANDSISEDKLDAAVRLKLNSGGGTQGATGPQGSPGTNGTDGTPGATGPQGTAGQTGATGSSGPMGPSGPAGTTTWAGITDKPAVIAAGATEAEARAAIGVGAGVWAGTQAEYDALSSYSDDILYYVRDIGILFPPSLAKFSLDTTVSTAGASVTRSQFAPREQMLSRDLLMVAPVGNDMVTDTASATWGWFNGGWWRSEGMIPINGRIQESILTLSWFYTQNRPWNPYYRNETLALRILAAIRYLISIQREDGGFAEYSAISTAAPTGFVLAHLALAYQLLSREPLNCPGGAYWQKQLLNCLSKAATWALNPAQSEQWIHGAHYSNQLIASLSGIARIQELLSPDLRGQFYAALNRLGRVVQGSAGYLFEDSGPDFGYTTSVGLPFLAYLYQATGRADLLVMAENAFKFISYNVLWEPTSPDGGFLWNDSIATRTPLVWSSGTRSDEAGVLDMASILRVGAPSATAFLTSLEGKAAQRAAWAADTTAVTPIPAGQVSPHRIHRAVDAEDLPTAAEKSLALAALPCASAPFTAYKLNGAESGVEAAAHRYLYVKRLGYYIGTSWGRYVANTRLGPNFFYHPNTGAFVCGQRNSEAFWGMVQGSYSDAKGQITSTTTPPTDASAFVLNLTAVSSTRSMTFNNYTVAVTAAKSGAFVERLPLVVWNTDTVTFNLSGGGTSVATAANSAASNVTSVEVNRPGRGKFTLTPSAAANMTLYAEESTATKPTSTRTIRRLEIDATNSITYTVTIVPA